MPKRMIPKTFDQHLGSVIDGLARGKGGREWLATLTDWSVGTVERRATGRAGFSVKELEIVAKALGTTRSAIVSQALRNYADGSEEEGIEKLVAEASKPAVSEPPININERRSKKFAEMTDKELEGLPGVANEDDDIGHDEPEHP